MFDDQEDYDPNASNNFISELTIDPVRNSRPLPPVSSLRMPRINVAPSLLQESAPIEEFNLNQGAQICYYLGCGRVFDSYDELLIHYKEHDREVERPYGCRFQDCQMTFVSENELQVHEITHAGVQVPEVVTYTCKIVGCGKTFTTEFELNYHRRSHKLYACRIKGCSKRYCWKKSLDWHLKKDHSQRERRQRSKNNAPGQPRSS